MPAMLPMRCRNPFGFRRFGTCDYSEVTLQKGVLMIDTASRLGNFALCTVLTLAIFFMDINIPLGIAIGALYVIVIVLSSLSDSPRLTHFFSLASSSLLVVGVYLYPAKVMSLSMVILNRSIYFVLIWLTAALIVRNQRMRAMLREKEAHLAAANAILEELALHDSLTGLPNRRHFDERLDSEYHRAVREHHELSLLMLDVDYFKKYNDIQGHQAGDDCLKGIAQAIDADLRRPGDMAARYGGEEFAVILPATGKWGAVERAEAVRRAIESLAILHPDNPMKNCVTVSVGVATIHPPDDASSTASLIEAADKALYEAKHEGRNRVSSANPVAETT